ncbi:MFS transporter [Rhodoluna sp.]|uniref:MFS transporter n=1 Tax=Rhodoluna sp. TaxID=1969481 RepID=UPI0025E50B56|nr:MFS transporter [Rhodoluna sp.]
MTKRNRRPVWLTRNLAAISWVSLLQDASSEMLYPIMPVLLNSVLGAPAAVVGAIEGAAEGAMAATKLASGGINRYIPRKMMVFLGYGGAALGKVFVALASIWPMVLVGRVVDRLGKGMRSAARDAILVQGVDKTHRGRVIGFHRTSDTTGAVIGPLLALAMLSLFNNDIRPVLWIAVIPAVLSVVAVLFIKDTEPRTRLRAKPSLGVAAEDNPEISQKLDSRVSRVVTLLSLFALVNFPDALLILHVSQVGFDVMQVVAIYLLFNICYAALSFPMGMLADRVKPQYVYAIGLVCFAVAYAGLGLTSDPAITILLIAIYGGFAAANDVVGKSWVSKLAPDHQQMTVQARLQGLSGFGILIAGIWAGLTWNLGGGFGTVPLVISGVLGLGAAILISSLRLTK